VVNLLEGAAVLGTATAAPDGDWLVTTSLAAGRHALAAMATDAAGNTQPDVPPWNRLGYGNNAIEVVYIDRN